MKKRLLHVISFTLTDRKRSDEALCHLQMLRARSKDLRCAQLLFCDLPSAPAEKLPQDDPAIQDLMRRVNAMHARQNGGVFLLVRRRTWDDAARQFLGREQPLSCRQVIAQLLSENAEPAAFEAASFPVASLRDTYDAFLFSDFDLSCTPDMPARMLGVLQNTRSDALAAPVLFRREYPQTVLARLCALSSFSLSPLRAAQESAFFRAGQCPADHPAIYTSEALIRFAASPVSSLPAAPGCFFVPRRSVSFSQVIDAYQSLCARQGWMHALLPLFQVACLIAASLLGNILLAGTAFLPELWAFAHPRQWPGALLRTALLPMTALLSLDVLLCRLLARSPLFRARVSDRLISPLGCVLSGSVLIPAALCSAQAFSVLLPVFLLWLSAPLLLPALDSPTLERIALDQAQCSLLLSMAQSAYFDASIAPSCAPLDILAACAGCMLGLLEPDEAARQIQSFLDTPLVCTSAAEQAALLAGAQYLRERMRDCDAALRTLPARLEKLALSHQIQEAGALGAFLLAAHDENALSAAVFDKTSAGPLDALFLPLASARDTAQQMLSLPLTHPHTFLRRYLLEADAAHPEKTVSISRFLYLAAAALGHPFYALLLRSPVTGPYAALLAV